jgi:peptide/nickel transport system substrate-binding protein
MSDTPTTTPPSATRKPMNRRLFLRRSLVVVGSAAVGATLLASCWPFGDDDEVEDDENGAEPTPEPVEDEDDDEDDPEPVPVPTPTPAVSPTPEPTATPTPVAIPDDPQMGGTLRIALEADPFSLHPNADESVINWTVMNQIYDALIEVDDQFEPIPVLAERYEISEDGSEYVFTIPNDVLFQNGEPMTASDVVYSHEWMRVPENGGARSFYYERVETIEERDATTVVFRMSGPDGTVVRRAATTFIVNEDYQEEFGAERQSSEPIGTGPFALDTWVRGVSLTLERFPEYHGDTAHLDRIVCEVIASESGRRSALENGQVDVVWGLTIDDDLELEDDGEVQSFQSTNLDCMHIALNNQHPVLSDQQVRFAMQHAIDRQAVIDVVYQGAAVEAQSHLSPALFYWHLDLFEADRSVAIDRLDAAGWEAGSDGIRERNGERLSFTCRVPDGQDPRAEGAEAIADMLEEIGVEMNLETAQSSETVSQMRSGELDAALFNWTYGGWLGEPDGRTTLLTGAFNNFSQFSSIQVDNVLYQGVSESDPEARRAIYRNLQERIIDLSPFLFIAFPYSWYHTGIRVQGLPESARWGPRLLHKLNDCWVFDPE